MQTMISGLGAIALFALVQVQEQDAKRLRRKIFPNPLLLG